MSEVCVAKRWRVGLLLLAFPWAAQAAERIELVWPTPHPAWAQGRPARDFLMHAGSGDPDSGGTGDQKMTSGFVPSQRRWPGHRRAKRRRPSDGYARP